MLKSWKAEKTILIFASTTLHCWLKFYIYVLQFGKNVERSSFIFYSECSNLGDAIHHLADCLKEDKQYDYIFGDLTDVPIDTDHTSKPEPRDLNT